jgi:hypothetical protein
VGAQHPTGPHADGRHTAQAQQGGCVQQQQGSWQHRRPHRLTITRSRHRQAQTASVAKKSVATKVASITPVRRFISVSSRSQGFLVGSTVSASYASFAKFAIILIGEIPIFHSTMISIYLLSPL